MDTADKTQQVFEPSEVYVKEETKKPVTKEKKKLKEKKKTPINIQHGDISVYFK